MQAKMTSKPDDDVIVARIRDLQQEEKNLSAEIKELQTQESRNQQSFQELEDLRRRFRQSSYDSRHSYFPGGFELAVLLGMLMSGRASGGDVWDRIGREQRFRQPRTPPDFGGGVFPGGFGGRSPEGAVSAAECGWRWFPHRRQILNAATLRCRFRHAAPTDFRLIKIDFFVSSGCAAPVVRSPY
jgi:hypothetical protein